MTFPRAVRHLRAARFGLPLGIATDRSGNVYVADYPNDTVRKITPDGTVSTVVGTPGRPGFAPGTLPGVIDRPVAVAIRGTSLYIACYSGVAVVQHVP